MPSCYNCWYFLISYKKGGWRKQQVTILHRVYIDVFFNSKQHWNVFNSLLKHHWFTCLFLLQSTSQQVPSSLPLSIKCFPQLSQQLKTTKQTVSQLTISLNKCMFAQINCGICICINENDLLNYKCKSLPYPVHKRCSLNTRGLSQTHPIDHPSKTVILHC